MTEHPLYYGLGQTNASRREAYNALFKAHIDSENLKATRAAWLTGTPPGNGAFKQKMERKLKSNVGQARRGRPNRT